jgi:hypothetical protein
MGLKLGRLQMKIKLESSQIDEIIVKELTNMYGNFLTSSFPFKEDTEEGQLDLQAFSRVLSYYTTKDEHAEIMRKLNKGK